MVRGSGLPTGTVTFMLTDVEGSTRLWEEHPDTMGAAVERHGEVIEKAVTEHRGVLVKSKGEGDSTFSVFARPTDAVVAAVAAQRALGAEPWPDGVEICVRAALHTGEAELRDGDYYGTSVNRCARLRAVAHGGQTICSQTTADLVADGLPDGVGVRSLGTHRLKDLERPEQIFQISRADFPEEFAPLRSLDAFRHNLPTQRTSFIGREDELIQIRKLLGSHRLVTLTGVGGCGKTRLALQLAADEVDGYTDGVYFVDLAPVSDPDVLPSAVASAVGLGTRSVATGTARPVREDLLDFFSDSTSLIVLDNCEHLVEACAELCDGFMERCSKVMVLATSREALEVEGEQTYSVPSLSVPRDEEPMAAESVRLFRDRASAVRPDFELRKDNSEPVAEICRRLDGIPLAIELAAAQVSHLSPQQIAERLGDRFRLLTGGRRRVQRQQTLGAALDWGYELLDEPERVLLRRLAVFPGSFTLQAAESVCREGLGQAVVALVRSLVGKSLIVTEEVGGDLRYRLLETVRLYAEDKLLHAGEADPLRSRHRDYFLGLTESFPEEDVLWGYEASVTLNREQHNIRAAIAWSAGENRLDIVGRLASRGLAIIDVGPADEAARWLSVVLENPDLPRELRVDCSTAAAWVANFRMDGETMVRYAQEAIDNAEDPSNPWLPLAYVNVGLYWSFWAAMGDEQSKERAEALTSRAVEMARSAPRQVLQSILVMRGMALAGTGDYEQAQSVLGELAASTRGLDSYWGVGPMAASRRSLVLHLLRRYAEALEAASFAAEQAEPMWRERQVLGMFSDPGWELWTAAPLGLALAAVGRREDSHEHLTNVLWERRGTKVPGILAESLVILGAIAGLNDDWERASRLLSAAGREVVTRSPPTFRLHRHYVLKAREALGVEHARRCREEGFFMPVDEAIEYGLAGIGGA